VSESENHETTIARLLAEGYQEATVPAIFRDGLLSRTTAIVARRGRRPVRRWVTGLAVGVALLAVAVGIWHLLGDRSAPVRYGAPLVAVIAARGSVVDAQGEPVAVGDKLPVGVTVSTGPDARATLITRRGSEFSLAPESALWLERARSARLVAGRLYCRTRAGEISRIDTAAGRIHLLGTTLDAHVQNETSVAVTVLEGRVRLANSQGEAEVTSGRRSVLVAALPPAEGEVVNRASAPDWYYGRTDIESDFGEVAYVVSRERAQGLATEVWAMDPDGPNKRRLKTYLGRGRAPGPWLPGQRWLLYRADSLGCGGPIVEDQAWLLNAVGNQDVAFELPPGADPFYTDLSPDGARLAFNGRYQPDPDGRQTIDDDLWVFDMTAGDMRKLLDGPMKTPMSWAPDSRRIVAATGKGYVVHQPLVVVDADTGEIRDLGVNGAGGTFSPDGTKVAYCGEFQGGGIWSAGVPASGRILIHDLRTDESLPISPPGEGALEPRWSPDGRHVAYCFNIWGEDDPAGGQPQVTTSICVAAADGSGSQTVFETEAGVRCFSWMPSGGALYLATEQGVHIIAADGSGLLADLGGSGEDSLLGPGREEQTAGALDAIQEAIHQYALGNIGRFEGKPRDVQAAFGAAADIFAGLAWEYPLADLSPGQLLLYADKCAQLATTSSIELLAESCQTRMNHLRYRLVLYVADKHEFPSDLAAVVQHSLESTWRMQDWFSNQDTERVRMLSRCPVAGPLTYHQPVGDAEIGHVLVSCSSHPEHQIVWSAGLARHLAWQERAAARRAERESEKLQ
jgi:hypothetical protein